MKRSYIDQVHYDGKLWGFIGAGVMVLFPVALCIIFQVLPEWNGLLWGFLGVAPLFWTVGIIEVFTYVPMLGAGGSYLSFVTGNISNLKLPCALNTLEQTGVKPDTEEGEIISTISIAVSSIVTTVIIVIGVIAIIPLTPILENETLTPAFDSILPALFGGLGVVYISKNWKIALAPVIFMLIIFSTGLVGSGLVSIMVPVGAIIAIVSARIMYKKGWIGAPASQTGKPAAANAVNADSAPLSAEEEITDKDCVSPIKEEKENTSDISCENDNEKGINQ